MLSTMTLEMWAMCTVMCISCVGWAYECYKGREKDKKVHKAYKEGYERGIKEATVEYEFKEEMKRWTA